jgi:hypothetical protein
VRFQFLEDLQEQKVSEGGGVVAVVEDHDGAERGFTESMGYNAMTRFCPAWVGMSHEKRFLQGMVYFCFTGIEAWLAGWVFNKQLKG